MSFNKMPRKKNVNRLPRSSDRLATGVGSWQYYSAQREGSSGASGGVNVNSWFPLISKQGQRVDNVEAEHDEIFKNVQELVAGRLDPEVIFAVLSEACWEVDDSLLEQLFELMDNEDSNSSEETESNRFTLKAVANSLCNKPMESGTASATVVSADCINGTDEAADCIEGNFVVGADCDTMQGTVSLSSLKSIDPMSNNESIFSRDIVISDDVACSNIMHISDIVSPVNVASDDPALLKTAVQDVSSLNITHSDSAAPSLPLCTDKIPPLFDTAICGENLTSSKHHDLDTSCRLGDEQQSALSSRRQCSSNPPNNSSSDTAIALSHSDVSKMTPLVDSSSAHSSPRYNWYSSNCRRSSEDVDNIKRESKNLLLQAAAQQAPSNCNDLMLIPGKMPANLLAGNQDSISHPGKQVITGQTYERKAAAWSSSAQVSEVMRAPALSQSMHNRNPSLPVAGQKDNHGTVVSAQQAYVRVQKLLMSSKRVLVLMRGCPGCGKTTLARCIQFNGVILSADDYFVDAYGVYWYDPNLIGEAHVWNQNRAQEAMMMGCNPLIIDNTNIHMWHMLPYAALAQQFNYVIEVFEPDTSWRRKATRLAKYNCHGVTINHIKRMLERYEHNVTPESLCAALNTSSSFQAAKSQFENSAPAVTDIAGKSSKASKRASRHRNRQKLPAPGGNSSDQGHVSSSVVVELPSSSVSDGRNVLPSETVSVPEISLRDPSSVPSVSAVKVASAELLLNTCQPAADSECEAASMAVVESCPCCESVAIICSSAKQHEMDCTTSSESSLDKEPKDVLQISDTIRSLVLDVVSDHAATIVSLPLSQSLEVLPSGDTEVTPPDVDCATITSDETAPGLTLSSTPSPIVTSHTSGTADEKIVSDRSPPTFQEMDDDSVLKLRDFQSTAAIQENCVATSARVVSMVENESKLPIDINHCQNLENPRSSELLQNLDKSSTRDVEGSSQIIGADDCQTDENSVTRESCSGAEHVVGDSCIGTTLLSEQFNNEDRIYISIEGNDTSVVSLSAESIMDAPEPLVGNIVCGILPSGTQEPVLVGTSLNVESDKEIIIRPSSSSEQSGISDETNTYEASYWRVSEKMSNGNCMETETQCCDNRLAMEADEKLEVVAVVDASELAPKPQRKRERSSRKLQLSESKDNENEDWFNGRSGTSPDGEVDMQEWTQCSTTLPVSPGGTDAQIDGTHHYKSAPDLPCISVSTMTEPSDFVALSNAIDSKPLPAGTSYGAVLDTTPRVISLVVDRSPDDSPRKIPFRSNLDKSCSTADSELEFSNFFDKLDFLTSCFPMVTDNDLSYILSTCGNDVVMAVDLITESGYEFNEPRDEEEKLADVLSALEIADEVLTEAAEAADISTDLPAAELRKKKTMIHWYRLCRDSLISKGVVVEEKPVRSRQNLLQYPPTEMGSLLADTSCSAGASGKTTSCTTVKLVLTPDVASQLIQLFGPIGAETSKASEKLSVELDIETARSIHRCWRDTQQRRRGTMQTAEKEASGDLEWLAESFSHSYQESNATQAHLLATKIKRQHLRDSFPNINPTVLDDIFKDNGYSLDMTMRYITSCYDLLAPPVNVMTDEAAFQYEMELLSQAMDESLQDQVSTGSQTSLPDRLQSGGKSALDVEYEETLTRLLHHRSRHMECMRQAADAQRKRTWSVAAHYSHQARQHKDAMDRLKLAAAELFVRQRSEASDTTNYSIDLHGLTVQEAVHVLQTSLTRHERDLQCRTGHRQDPYMLVIVGRGRHNQKGVSRLRPAVVAFLKSNNYQFAESALGVLKVRLHYNS